MTSFTVINDQNALGLLLLGMSKNEIDDVLDYLELASPDAQEDAAVLIHQADKEQSWLPMEKVHAKARKSA